MRELTLDELRELHDADWPGLQADLEAARVEEIAEARVVPCERALTRAGCAYGVRVSTDAEPAPCAPNLRALPGRYRAWVLAQTGIAVALEPLDDDDVYLRAHRDDLFALQRVSDGDLVPLASMKRVAAGPSFPLVTWLRNSVFPTYVEDVLRSKQSHADVVLVGAENAIVSSLVFARLVRGVTYRFRPKLRGGYRIFEPVVADMGASPIGPYR